MAPIRPGGTKRPPNLEHAQSSPTPVSTSIIQLPLEIQNCRDHFGEAPGKSFTGLNDSSTTTELEGTNGGASRTMIAAPFTLGAPSTSNGAHEKISSFTFQTSNRFTPMDPLRREARDVLNTSSPSGDASLLTAQQYQKFHASLAIGITVPPDAKTLVPRACLGALYNLLRKKD